MYAVFFNAKGTIVGGAYEPDSAAVQPKATVSFNFMWSGPPPVAKAQASADPCFWLNIFAAPSQVCPVSSPESSSHHPAPPSLTRDKRTAPAIGDPGVRSIMFRCTLWD